MGVVCIKLDSAAWEAAKARVALIQQAEAELTRQRAMLELLVSQATGLDLSSGNYTLDIEHGLLEETEPATPVVDEITPRRKSRKSANPPAEPA